MAHTPRALVGHSRLAFDFLRRNSVTRTGHEIHGEKPNREFGRRLVEDRSRTRVNMMPAFLAGESAPRTHHVEIGKRATAGAENVRSAVVDFHELGETGRVIGIFGLELFEGVL
jgi:hypothetical protein